MSKQEEDLRKYIRSGDIKGLLNILQNEKDWMTRFDAAEALARLGNEQGKNHLIDALQDNDEEKKAIAKEILEGLENKNVGANPAPMRDNVIWVLEPIKKYAVFEGRAHRKEYWSFVIGSFVAYLLVAFAVAFLIQDTDIVNPILYLILATLVIPFLAATVRRLHDLGYSAWYLLVGLIPYIGIGVIFFWATMKGQFGENKYGPDPQLFDTTYKSMGQGALEMTQNYCGKCGNAVQPKDLFCRKCGAPLDSKTTTESNTDSAATKTGVMQQRTVQPNPSQQNTEMKTEATPSEKINKPEQKTVHCDKCDKTNGGVYSSFMTGEIVSSDVKVEGKLTTTTTTYTNFFPVSAGLCLECLKIELSRKLKEDRVHATWSLLITIILFVLAFGALKDGHYENVSLLIGVLVLLVVLLGMAAQFIGTMKSNDKSMFDGLLLRGEDFNWFNDTLMKEIAQKKTDTTKRKVFTDSEYAKLKITYR